MQTQCISEQLRFEGFDGRRVEAAFDGGAVTSDAGALLLREADRAISLIDRVAACFRDGRDPGRTVHSLRTLVGQRIIGLALGYEDVADHDDLRFDPVLALFSDRLEPRRPDCAALGGKSTLNRLEHTPRDHGDRYRRIAVDRNAVEDLFVAVSRRPCQGAAGDRARSRRHRRPAARRPGGPLLPRLLRLLVLPAALRVLRSPPARRQAQAVQHRRLGRCRRRGGADRRAHPRALAPGADPAPCRLGLRPRGADGVVRDPSRRLRLRPRPQQPARRRLGHRHGLGRGRARENRPGGAPVQGLPLRDTGQLEPSAAGDRQGRAPGQGRQPALRRHLAETPGDRREDPLREGQEGRFFHGYYGCWCYLPLYVFCGRHLLAAKLRRSNIDASAGAVDEVARIVARIRERWPRVRILLRADSGFAREALMAWCETHRVDYVFGLARNSRLVDALAIDMAWAEDEHEKTGQAVRRFKDFRYATLDSWSRRRRVIGKAEHLAKGANPRFVVTSLKRRAIDARILYEKVYCARGEMENRIKEQQLDLFADRTSTATMAANQLRLWFSSFAYVLMAALRRLGLHHTEFEAATCGTIRLKLLKIGARVTVSVRRIKIAMASACPYQPAFALAHARLRAPPA